MSRFDWQSSRLLCLPVFFFCFLLTTLAGYSQTIGQTFGQTGSRGVQDLDGRWDMRVDATSEWMPVVIPDTFESLISPTFDGTAEFRKQIEPVPLPEGGRLLLHFDAVATHARVFVNGIEVGEHLGGWQKPFPVRTNKLTEDGMSDAGGLRSA